MRAKMRRLRLGPTNPRLVQNRRPKLGSIRLNAHERPSCVILTQVEIASLRRPTARPTWKLLKLCQDAHKPAVHASGTNKSAPTGIIRLCTALER